MFGKKADPGSTPSGAPISTILGEKSRMQGELEFSGSMRVDGIFDGSLQGEYLIVGKTGSVHGDVRCTNCICHGQVHGQMACDSLHLKQGSYFEGTILTRELSVEPGSSLNGDIRQHEDEVHLIDGEKIEKIGAIES
jgi:cytoskeletal protein CcmA (bactofilin family)